QRQVGSWDFPFVFSDRPAGRSGTLVNSLSVEFTRDYGSNHRNGCRVGFDLQVIPPLQNVSGDPKPESFRVAAEFIEYVPSCPVLPERSVQGLDANLRAFDRPFPGEEHVPQRVGEFHFDRAADFVLGLIEPEFYPPLKEDAQVARRVEDQLFVDDQEFAVRGQFPGAVAGGGILRVGRAGVRLDDSPVHAECKQNPERGRTAFFGRDDALPRTGEGFLLRLLCPLKRPDQSALKNGLEFSLSRALDGSLFAPGGLPFRDGGASVF